MHRDTIRQTVFEALDNGLSNSPEIVYWDPGVLATDLLDQHSYLEDLSFEQVLPHVKHWLRLQRRRAFAVNRSLSESQRRVLSKETLGALIHLTVARQLETEDPKMIEDLRNLHALIAAAWEDGEWWHDYDAIQRETLEKMVQKQRERVR